MDYEATNTKPFDSFFEITHITFSLAQTALVFHESLWLDSPEIWETIKDYMVKILINKSILKIIQNAKFEDLCSRFIFGIKQLEHSFCTMLATHVVDERRGCTSLDFQNLMRFGIPPYSETVKSFLQSKSKDDKCNRIRLAPHDDMILYAGLDGITTYNNYKVLNEEILPYAYPEAYANYRFLHKGHWVFANMTQRGISIDGNEFEDMSNTLDHHIDKTIQEISKIPEILEYNEYLKDKVIDKKSGDKKIKELIQSIKGKEKTNGSSKTSKRSTTKNGRINRKISFS